jgi:hypothetical protein
VSGLVNRMLSTLTAFKVTEWGPDSAMPSTKDREAASLDEAHVISSLIKDTVANPHPPNVLSADELFGHKIEGGFHQVVLDIDWPAELLESSTPGHYHLYVQIPGGVPWEKYEAFLKAAADIDLIQEGYAAVSMKRGHTDVRLPWVQKGFNRSKDEEKAATS